MNRFMRSDIDKLTSTSKPPYPAPDAFQYCMELHNNLSRVITPVYVLDGIAPDVKKKTKLTRQRIRDSRAADYLDLLGRALEDNTLSFSDEEIKKATEKRMELHHPTRVDHNAIVNWLQRENIEHYGSLAEADQQMVQLEKDGVVDGIISEDGDIIALGGKLVLCKISRKSNGDYQFKVFDRELFFHPDNPYNSKLCLHPSLLTEAALLLGNDYVERADKNGAGRVLGYYPNKTPKGKRKGIARKNDGLIDMLAQKEDKEQWLKQYGWLGKKPLPDYDAFQSASRYMKHAPVLRKCPATGRVMIVPLNNLPGGVDNLFEYLGSNFELDLTQNNDALLSNIYHCDILPLDRQPLEEHSGPMSSDGSRPAAMFEILNFNEQPICSQPTLCLVNWLRARRYDVKLSDPREEIEGLVKQCYYLKKDQTRKEPLKPIVGTHNGFEKIKPRVAKNERDNWSKNYRGVAKQFETISDDVIDRLLGNRRAGRPSIRHRVKNLVDGGHYHPKELKCRNVTSKIDGRECILMCCPCLSSKSNVTHKE